MTMFDIFKDIKNVILYPRKSREDVEREKETGEDCLAAMTEMLVNAINRYKIPNYIEKPEVGSADTIKERPVFTEIIEELIPSGIYQGIVVREISRLGRGNFSDADKIYSTIIQNNFYIITPYRIYDPSNLADRRQIRMELFFAREEYETTKERLWEYRNAKAQKGFSGNRSMTLGLNSIRGKWIIVPEEAAITLKVFQLRAKFMSYPEISDELNRCGLRSKTGGKFYPGTIYKIIHNKRCIGIHTWLGVEYPAQHPPFIPIELWNYVHQVVQPQFARQISNPRDNEYLVEVYCKECGSRMYGYKQKRKNSPGYILYDCCGRRNKAIKCTHIKSGQVIHRAAMEALKKIVLHPDLLFELSKERNEGQAVRHVQLTEQIKEKEGLIVQKEKFLVKLDIDYEKGDLVSELYNRRYSETNNIIKHLKTEIVKLKKEIKSFEIKTEPVEKIREKLEYCLAQWEALDNKKRKAIFKTFLLRFEISRDNTCYITYNLPNSMETFHM